MFIAAFASLSVWNPQLGQVRNAEIAAYDPIAEENMERSSQQSNTPRALQEYSTTLPLPSRD